MFSIFVNSLWRIALFGVVLTSAIFNFQLLYFEQDANGGYGLALQVLCINISDAPVSQLHKNFSERLTSNDG